MTSKEKAQIKREARLRVQLAYQIATKLVKKTKIATRRQVAASLLQFKTDVLVDMATRV